MPEDYSAAIRNMPDDVFLDYLEMLEEDNTASSHFATAADYKECRRRLKEKIDEQARK